MNIVNIQSKNCKTSIYIIINIFQFLTIKYCENKIATPLDFVVP